MKIYVYRCDSCAAEEYVPALDALAPPPALKCPRCNSRSALQSDRSGEFERCLFSPRYVKAIHQAWAQRGGGFVADAQTALRERVQQ